MTRQLKFRAWDHDNDKMIFWSLSDLLIGFGEPQYQYNVIDRPSFLFDWMEYVGLEDKNGKEIYTGDIVKSGEFTYKIIFKEGCFGYEVIDPINKISMNFANLSKELAQIIEVVGNVYEHGTETAEVGIMEDITRKSLLQLPEREWDTKSIYDSIILINSRKKKQ